MKAWQKQTHIQAADVDLDAPFVVVLRLSNLVQEVEVGSRVLQSNSTRRGYARVLLLCVGVCLC